MKTIKDLTVKVTYRAGLGNVTVPDDVYLALVEMFESGESECVSDWLSDNIHEEDGYDFEYEIEDLTTVIHATH
jgi:hypothetical protein